MSELSNADHDALGMVTRAIGILSQKPDLARTLMTAAASKPVALERILGFADYLVSDSKHNVNWRSLRLTIVAEALSYCRAPQLKQKAIQYRQFLNQMNLDR